MYIGAIDIGGTSIKTAIVTETGEILHPSAYPTEASKGGEHVMQNVLQICSELQSLQKIDGIAISSAGQVDTGKGSIVFATDNIPGYTGMNVRERIQDYTGLPVSIENDVNCTALGESWVGSARGIQDFLTVTLGTGIGGALYLDGKLYRGAAYSGGEIGHMILYPQGKPCTCNQNGCFEQYASASALAKAVEEQMGNIDLPAFFERLQQKDSKAIVLFDKWVDDLTTGIASLVQVLNPTAIVIGGGISKQSLLLHEPIHRALFAKLMPNHKKGLQLLFAERGNDANLLGAVRHFLHCNPV